VSHARLPARKCLTRYPRYGIKIVWGRWMRLQLHIMAQALEDVLRFELNLPLVGVKGEYSEAIYWEAFEFLLQYPGVTYRLATVPNKHRWLKELQDARVL